MKLLLDTHLLLWAGFRMERVPASVLLLLESPGNLIYFSSATIWEIAIKKAQGKASFQVDAVEFYAKLLDSGYRELPIDGTHGGYVQVLPPIHKDPFDRILVAQATIEGITLLTADRRLATYPGPIQLV